MTTVFVKKIAKQSETGSATTIISGLAVGMQSTAVPILLVSAGILVANRLMGLYGIALAAVGMLSTTGITVAIDAYGLSLITPAVSLKCPNWMTPSVRSLTS